MVAANKDSDERTTLKEDLSSVVPLVKAHFIDPTGVPATAVQTESALESSFRNAGAIEPPFDPETLCALFQHSSALRPNVDAYMTNIDGFGHRFESVIDMKSHDADEKIADAMLLDRLHNQNEDEIKDLESLMPSEDEVAKVKKRVAIGMRLERARLKTFFDFCCVDISFITLRRRTRQDLEVLGNAWWEILRNRRNEVAQFTYVPGFTVRLMPLEDERMQTVEVRIKTSPITFKKVQMKRRFRRFVQIFEEHVIFFKELGDPRVISRKTGKEFPDEQSLLTEDNTDRQATELIHFAIHDPESAYGVPRWIGNLLTVLGSRQADEVNFLYFDNKSVPPLVFIVSGGAFSKETHNRIRDFIENRIKGRRNFHSIMILEAEPAGGKTGENAGNVKIAIEPLTKAQHNDALFQKYDERNHDKIGMSFRLPRMLRGDIRDFNRSTADAALAFAEMQVFQPEREEFDFIINRKLLSAEFGIRYWEFMSRAPVTRDPKDMAEIIRNLSNANVLTPKLGLQLASDVFNKEFEPIDADWTLRPVALTVAGIGDQPIGKADLSVGDLGTGGGLRRPAQGQPVGGPFSNPAKPRDFDIKDLFEFARTLMKFRGELKKAECDQAESDFLEAKERLEALKSDSSGG